jgi:hypothetical protein
MPKTDKKIYLDFYQLVADIEEKFTIESRVEEGHGQHIIEDTNVLSREIVSLKILCGHEEIDITDRMTKEELKLLLER